MNYSILYCTNLVYLLLDVLLVLYPDMSVTSLVEAVDPGRQGTLGPHYPGHFPTEVRGDILIQGTN